MTVEFQELTMLSHWPGHTVVEIAESASMVAESVQDCVGLRIFQDYMISMRRWAVGLGGGNKCCNHLLFIVNMS